MVANIYAKNRRKARKAKLYRCFLNGREVTNECFYADTRRGVVKLYRRNESGQFYIDSATGTPATAIKRGKVKLRAVA